MGEIIVTFGDNTQPGDRTYVHPVSAASATATTLSPGSPATAAVRAGAGTDSVAFTFGVPKGDKGDRGEIGPIGPRGPQGIPGEVRLTGAVISEEIANGESAANAAVKVIVNTETRTARVSNAPGIGFVTTTPKIASGHMKLDFENNHYGWATVQLPPGLFSQPPCITLAAQLNDTHDSIGSGGMQIALNGAPKTHEFGLFGYWSVALKGWQLDVHWIAVGV